MIAVLFAAALLQAQPARSSARPTRAAQKPAVVAAKPTTNRQPATRVVARADKSARNVPRVVIDAGHGGVDPGAPMLTKGGLNGKDVTLQVAQRLADALKLRGIDVVQTRTRDTLIALADRGRMANQAAGDVFISIHVNAANKHWKNPSASRG